MTQRSRKLRHTRASFLVKAASSTIQTIDYDVCLPGILGGKNKGNSDSGTRQNVAFIYTRIHSTQKNLYGNRILYTYALKAHALFGRLVNVILFYFIKRVEICRL